MTALAQAPARRAPLARPAPVRPASKRPTPKRPAPALSTPVRRAAPTGSLGVAWATVLVAATVAGPAAVAAVVAPVVAVAVLSLLRKAGLAPQERLAGAVTATLVPFAAVGGWAVAVAVLVLGSAVAVARVPGAKRRSVAMAVGAPAAAATSLVLADRGSITAALCLAAAVCLFDLANHLMGTGPTGGMLGALAGVVTVAVLAVLAAAVISPPFSGSRPWVMFGVVAASAPLGVVLGRRMSRGSALPAVRRLDSLLLAGPAWVLLSHVLLH